MRKCCQATVGTMALLLSAGGAAGAGEARTLEACLLDALRTAHDELTVGELRARCATQLQHAPAVRGEALTVPVEAADGGVVERRLAMERAVESKPFTITPHRPNYIMPYTYNGNPNEAPFQTTLQPGEHIQESEAKFQVSFKFPLWYGLFDNRADLYFAYTNLSWWQLYNRDLSAPFRETNHEPELFLRVRTGWKVAGFRNVGFDVGLSHQSNGRAEPVLAPLSRSWNRIFANFVFEKGNFAFGIKPWWRIPEEEEDDDNPDLYKYVGYGEIRGAYLWNDHTITLMGRHNLRSDDARGALELTWSYPLWGVLRLYAQYFNGYGESLLDYDAHINRIGIGIAINDYLQ